MFCICIQKQHHFSTCSCSKSIIFQRISRNSNRYSKLSIFTICSNIINIFYFILTNNTNSFSLYNNNRYLFIFFFFKINKFLSYKNNHSTSNIHSYYIFLSLSIHISTSPTISNAFGSVYPCYFIAVPS